MKKRFFLKSAIFFSVVLAIFGVIKVGSALTDNYEFSPKDYIAVRLADFLLEDKQNYFGGLGGLLAQPYYVTTDNTVTTSSATSTNFIGNILPTVDNSFSVGIPTKRWKNVWISGTLYSSSTSFSGSLLPALNNTYDLGSYGASWRDVYSSGTTYSSGTLFGKGTAAAPSISFQGDTNTGFYTSTGDQIDITTAGVTRISINAAAFNSSAITANGIVKPATNNAYDLGTYAFSWNDIFASGTLFIGGSTATSTIDARTGGTKGTCHKDSDITGAAIYWWFDLTKPLSIATSTTACDI